MFTAGALKGIGGSSFGMETATGKYVARTLAHGVVGGLSQVARGGKFIAGFLSAGTAQTFSGFIDSLDPKNPGISASRTVAATTLGGITAELGGGKFLNGALTGAFSRLYNDDNPKHRRAQQEKNNKNLWDATKEGGTIKAGPGVGLHLKETKAGH